MKVDMYVRVSTQRQALTQTIEQQFDESQLNRLFVKLGEPACFVFRAEQH
jgi:hypothetical protein